MKKFCSAEPLGGPTAVPWCRVFFMFLHHSASFYVSLVFSRYVGNFKYVNAAQVLFHNGLFVLSVRCDKLMTCHHNTVYHSMLKIMFVVNTEYLVIPDS